LFLKVLAGVSEPLVRKKDVVEIGRYREFFIQSFSLMYKYKPNLVRGCTEELKVLVISDIIIVGNI
jgi:hypothetical protein